MGYPTSFNGRKGLPGRLRARSCAVWRLIQNSGVVPNACASNHAVSGVTARRPRTIPLMRWVEIPRCSASECWLRPSGTRNSSFRITPGWVGMRFVGSIAQLSSVVISEPHVLGVGSLPAENDAPLVVDANAVKPSQIADECLQAVSGRDTQVDERMSGIEHIKLSDGQTRPNGGSKSSSSLGCLRSRGRFSSQRA